MPRLTKSDIERKLLTGEAVEWADANKKHSILILDHPRKRRLFEFLLTSKVREPTGLSDEFIAGLSRAYNSPDDPASSVATGTSVTSTYGPWRLQSIETEAFGGLNVWRGSAFHFDFDEESLLLEGPNGSGKSSLIGAILWALSGERPRDQADSQAHEPKPVFGADDKIVGDWPPIACYPPDTPELISPPRVRVALTFKNAKGDSATVERTLDNGKVTAATDARIQIPPILLEAGLLMPSRLARLRLADGRGRLTGAVQTLTGLDDLVAIGAMVDGLCHKGREFLAHKRKELKPATETFESAIEDARIALAPVKVFVPDFSPGSTDDSDGEMARFGTGLSNRATELTQVISSDLSADLNLADPAVQRQVSTAIGSAELDLNVGLDALPAWGTLKTIATALGDETIELVSVAIVAARERAKEALELFERSKRDSKFQLKAVAAQWHRNHKTGPVDNCPLCEHDIRSAPSLTQELEALRSAGDAAARAFDDNLNAISAEFNSSLPMTLRNFGSEMLTWDPRAKLTEDFREVFVTKDRSTKTLVKFGNLAEMLLAGAPDGQLKSVNNTSGVDALRDVDERLAVADRLLAIAEWFTSNSSGWSQWWQTVTSTTTSSASGGVVAVASDVVGNETTESLLAHLSRLSDALAKAEPYRKGAEAMRKAWKSGKTAAEIENELNRREAIAQSLTPLKSLGSLAESVAREAIEGLSGRISNILERIYLSEQLQFHDTRLNRKEGLVVRGTVGPKLRIDATLIANTSWLRVVLWAFLFALREEAVEQIGTDPFPLLVFDDPQSTLDSEHRHRWAQYIESKQTGSSKTQVIIVTFDETFLDMIKVDGVTGRQAIIAAPGAGADHVSIFEGASLDRKWSETLKINTSRAGCDYIAAVRRYAEGMLRLMLRGEDARVSSPVIGFVLGESRDKLRELNTKGIAPWNRPQFRRLVKVLDKSLPHIKQMEIAHHAGGSSLGMAEATDVEAKWRKEISPALENSFRVARDHRLLHGGLNALHAQPPSVALPSGYKAKVQSMSLSVLGRAAALSGGRVADGVIDLDEFSTSAHKRIVLAQHLAFRLTAPTLEPVARRGDILLVKEPGEPSVKSLVVVLCDDRILARRFEVAENHSDIAVLTAQAINPRQIASPLIAHKSTLTLHKIVGVLYSETAWPAPLAQAEMEICDCGGESVFTRLATRSFGLVEIVGHSAEPHALDGQYLIIKEEITGAEALKTLDGKPIIAADTNDSRYFKRLRNGTGDQVVLESLDSGGDFEPVVLAAPGRGTNCLERVWPVAGVLFELPG